MTTPRVRLAEESELDAIGELTAHVYTDFVLGPDDPYLDQLRAARERARDGELWVAESDGDLLGTVTRAPHGSPLRDLALDGEGEFRMLAVARAAEGRGAGRALISRMIELCRADRDQALVISSLSRMHRAHAIYERMGFVRTPERDWEPAPDVRLVTYRLDLA